MLKDRCVPFSVLIYVGFVCFFKNILNNIFEKQAREVVRITLDPVTYIKHGHRSIVPRETLLRFAAFHLREFAGKTDRCYTVKEKNTERQVCSVVQIRSRFMTERLYLADSHQFSCEAKVVSCTANENGTFFVTFDRTVFFPNKGGQPCDTGTAGEAAVTDCSEKGTELVHTCDRALTVGETVTLTIDKARRLDIMRQHTGEHLLSWAMWELFSSVNVGFHCALDYATLDSEKPLGAGDIRAMEDIANAVVMDNRPVTARIYKTEEELEGVKLRKHTEGLEAPIRVVTVENSDSCTCCAPHVKNTGEIGLIKITQFASYKGGTRVTFLCGERALKYVQKEQDILKELAGRFSTATDKLPEVIEKQCAELEEEKKRSRQLSVDLEGYLTAELKAKAEKSGSISLLVERVKADPKRLRPLAQSTLTGKSITLLFAQNGESVGYVLVCSGLKENMGEWIPAINAALNGKGGGRGDMAQGSAQTTLSEETFAQLKSYMRARTAGIK